MQLTSYTGRASKPRNGSQKIDGKCRSSCVNECGRLAYGTKPFSKESIETFKAPSDIKNTAYPENIDRINLE